MSDTQPVPETSAPVGVPVVVEADGWTVTSGSPGTSQEVLRETMASSTPPAEPPPSEPAAPEPAAETKPDDEKPADKPKKHTPATQRVAEIQAQIRALTAQRYQEQAALERLRAEREALTPKAPERESEKTEPPPDKPTWAKYEEAGKSWDEYAEARDAWHEARNREWLAKITEEQRETARKEFEAIRAQEAQQAAERAHQQRLDAIKTKRPDFLERVTANLSEIPQTDFMADVVKLHPAGLEVLDYLADHPDEAQVLAELTLNATHSMMDAVQSLPDPTPLLSHFARNPDEFSRLAAMPPRLALVALGSVIARLDSAKSGSLSPAPVSAATPPIRPVGGTRSTTGAAPKSPEDIPFGPEYIKRMNEEELHRRRRL